MTWLWVALAGGVGAVLRYSLTLLHARAGKTSQVATFVTNVIGAFAMALVVSIPGGIEQHPALAAGLLGGFTTFSAASLDTAEDLRAGRLVQGVVLPLAMVASAVVAFFLGLMVYGILDALL